MQMERNAFDGNDIKIKAGDLSVRDLNHQTTAVYWYCEFKVTGTAINNGTIIIYQVSKNL